MSRIRLSLLFLSLFLALCWGCGSPAEPSLAGVPEQVDFNFHVRPILSDRCFACHGPDANKREANLRLDEPEGMFQQALESGGNAFVPGNPAKSEAFQRMTSHDETLLMPPPEANLQLTEVEIQIVQRWIEQGAPFEPHWAFLPPKRSNLPEVADSAWNRHPIDRLVWAKLNEKGLHPNVPAEKEVLLRRLHLDLTGLPPSPEEIDAFLADESPDAYERVVDRLLASPHYGERMALDWLDVARYADSHGYSQDGYRHMHPWRTWVIEAFNQNMPFDQFIQWQMAGDKAPNPSQDQLLATAFLRNSRANSEGGIVGEEYRVEAAVDRVSTTSTAFLGLTMECARCHDHKYDPFSQKEFYQLMAFFNQANETGLVQKDGNNGAEVLLTDEEVEAQLAFLEEKVRTYEAKLAATNPQYVDVPTFAAEEAMAVLDMEEARFAEVKNRTVLRNALQGEDLPCRGTPELVEEDGRKALKVTAYDIVGLGDILKGVDRAEAFSLQVELNPQHESDNMHILLRSRGKNESYMGIDLALRQDQLALRLIHAVPADLIEVRTKERLEKGTWTTVGLTYDGSGKAAGIRFFLDGKKADTEVHMDQLSRNLTRVGAGARSASLGGKLGYAEAVDDGYLLLRGLRFFDKDLSRPLLMEPVQQALYDSLQHYRTQQFNLVDTLPSVMVMQDVPRLRKTFILDRGLYDAPLEEVSAGTPEVVMPFADSLSRDRLGLAQWLTHPNNPLTARVLVNRFWQHLFGRGLVETAEDFGNQGALPSHPRLLDNLTLYFIESGWDVKTLMRHMLTSQTYQQSSRVSAEQRQEDPENVWLARGPSHRLPAELIRDQALQASGLLSSRIGGESVKPYQPEGLWSEKNTFSNVLRHYKQDHGEKLYRRSMYTFWRRTSHHPVMAILDAPTRDYCTVRRQQTNTPLQALALMNETQFTEASKAFAERAMKRHPLLENQLRWMYRVCTGLQPAEELLDLMKELQQEELLRFEAEPEQAEKLLAVGEYEVDPELEPATLASLTVVANLMLNLDETVMKR